MDLKLLYKPRRVYKYGKTKWKIDFSSNSSTLENASNIAKNFRKSRVIWNKEIE